MWFVAQDQVVHERITVPLLLLEVDAARFLQLGHRLPVAAEVEQVPAVVVADDRHVAVLSCRPIEIRLGLPVVAAVHEVGPQAEQGVEIAGVRLEHAVPFPQGAVDVRLLHQGLAHDPARLDGLPERLELAREVLRPHRIAGDAEVRLREVVQEVGLLLRRRAVVLQMRQDGAPALFHLREQRRVAVHRHVAACRELDGAAIVVVARPIGEDLA